MALESLTLGVPSVGSDCLFSRFLHQTFPAGDHTHLVFLAQDSRLLTKWTKEGGTREPHPMWLVSYSWHSLHVSEFSIPGFNHLRDFK